MLKSGNVEEKLSYAEAGLDSGNCFRALPLYDELMRLTRGTERAPDVHWNRALTHDCINDFYLSRYYFQSFVKTFPNDARVEEGHVPRCLVLVLLVSTIEPRPNRHALCNRRTATVHGPLSLQRPPRQQPAHG